MRWMEYKREGSTKEKGKRKEDKLKNALPRPAA